MNSYSLINPLVEGCLANLTWSAHDLDRATWLLESLCDGKPEDLALVFDKEPTYTYTVRYKGSLPILRLVGATVGEFNLPLVAADPYAYGAEDTDTANITASYQTMAVENAGDYRTPPTITITMKAGSGSVTGFTLITRKLK